MCTLTADRLRDMLETRRLTLRQAGEVLGLSHTHVFRLANRFGIRRRQQGLRGREEEIYELFLSGSTVAELASELSYTKRRIQQVIRAVKDEDRLIERGPVLVDPYRCPHHGVVRYRPCVACLAKCNNFAH